MESRKSTADTIKETAPVKKEKMKASSERSTKSMSDAINDVKNQNKTIRSNIRISAKAILAEIGKLD